MNERNSIFNEVIWSVFLIHDRDSEQIQRTVTSLKKCQKKTNIDKIEERFRFFKRFFIGTVNGTPILVYYFLIIRDLHRF